MKRTLSRAVLLSVLALGACDGDTPTSLSSKTTVASGPSTSSAQGNQDPVPVEGKGICQGKPTFRSVSGDVTYCVLSSDLSLQGNLCHFVKPDGPATLHHKIGVVTGAAGAYVKAPLSSFAPENDCGAVGSPYAAKGFLRIEEGDATGGVDVPPNSERTLSFAFDPTAATCGRVQSTADLLTGNGTSLSVAGFVLNYPTACGCTTLFRGSSFVPDVTPASRTLKAMGVATQKSFPLSVHDGETVTVDAFVDVSSRTVRSSRRAFVLSAILDCGVSGASSATSSDGTLHFVQPFAHGASCTATLFSIDPRTTSFSIKSCPDLEPADDDEGPAR